MQPEDARKLKPTRLKKPAQECPNNESSHSPLRVFPLNTGRNGR